MHYVLFPLSIIKMAIHMPIFLLYVTDRIVNDTFNSCLVACEFLEERQKEKRKLGVVVRETTFGGGQEKYLRF
jgi:hypothetical protein